MSFTITFLQYFSHLAYLVLPIIALLLALIVALGLLVGRGEGWSKGDSIYFAFVTATTVGYGDFHPKRFRAKLTAIGIALLGLFLTGIIVAIGLKAIEFSIDAHYSKGQLREIFGAKTRGNLEESERVQ